jgi:NADPH:quinone reductase-like Zn-dependent oxidoreductase
MKTIELHDSFGIDSLVLTDRSKPTPGAGEILLKINAVSLNYRDLLVVDGTFFPNLQFPFVPASFLVRNARVQSLTVGSRQSFEEMNAFLAEHQLHPAVDEVFSWRKTADAFRELKVGKHFGKLVLRLD